MRYSILPLPLVLLITACNPGPTVVVGDVYVVEAMESQINFGSIEVHLLPDGLQLDSALLKLCPNRDLSVPHDSADVAAAWEGRRELLLSKSQRMTRADPDASFVIDSVAPGRYRLWADTIVGDQRYTWLRSFLVRRGDDTVRANLGNSSLDEDPFRCFRKVW